MSLIRPPDLEQIDSDLRSDYERGRERHGHFDALRRVLLSFPPAFRAADRIYELIMESAHLTRRLKEQVFVACSAVRGCEYAVNAHSRWLREHTALEEEDINTLVRGEELLSHSELERVAVTVARKVSAAPYRTVSDDIAALRSAGLDEKGIVELMTVVSLSGWMNGYATAVGLRAEDVDREEPWH